MTHDRLSHCLAALRGSLPINELGQIHLSTMASGYLLNALRDAAAIAVAIENDLDALKWRLGRMTDPLRDMASAARTLADEIEPEPATQAAPDALDRRIEHIKAKAAALTDADLHAPRDARTEAARRFAAAQERAGARPGAHRLRLVVDNPQALDVAAAMDAIADAIGVSSEAPIDALAGDRAPADPLARDLAEDGA